jgi:hypothetical protein
VRLSTRAIEALFADAEQQYDAKGEQLLTANCL